MRDNFPKIDARSNTLDILNWCIAVDRQREFDLEDYDEQVNSNPKIYLFTPVNSTDLFGVEKAGDIAVDADYLYYVIDTTGNGDLEWRRIAGSSF